MASLDLVDRLRERTGVSYDEAREALDNSDDDMLDALIWLEQNGRIEQPEVARFSTGGDEETDRYIRRDTAGSASDSAYNKTISDGYYDSGKSYAEQKKKKAGSGHKHKYSKPDHKYKKSDYSYKERNAYKTGDAYSSGGAYKPGGAYKSSDAKYHDRTNINAGRGSHKHGGKHDSYYYDKMKSTGASFVSTAARFIGKAFQVGNATMFEVTRYGKEMFKFPLTLLVIACIMFFQVMLIVLPVSLFFGFRYKLTGDYFNNSPLNSIIDTAADAVDGIKDAFNKNK